jgi:HSP20 family protein
MSALQRQANGDAFARTPFAGLVEEMFRELPRPVMRTPLDVEETNEAYVIRCDVPGVDPKDIQLEVNNDMLTLKAERKTPHVVTEHSFELPKKVDASRIEAQVELGVLTLTLPKREEAKPRTIEVKVR